MTPSDFTDPATDAYAYSEAVADALGDDAADGFFEALTDELFELHPALRQHFSDLLMTELVEELVRRGQKDAAERVSEVQDHWSREA